MFHFRRPKPPAGCAAARQKIMEHRTPLQTAATERLAALSAAIECKADNVHELIADTFPFVEMMATAVQQLDMVLAANTKATTSARPARRTFYVSSRTLQDWRQFVTSDENGHERMFLGTGIETPDGNVVLAEKIEVRTSSKSAAYVAAHPGHTAVQIDQLNTSGHRLWLMAHSHIMRGKASTRPSHTDIEHQNRMVEWGLPDMLGMIFNLDGWCRVFSTAKPFDLHVYGSGVTITDDLPREKILKLDLPENSNAASA